MKLKLEAHDLLWGMTVDCFTDDAPDWVREVLLRGDPVVVRRAITPEDQVVWGKRAISSSTICSSNATISD